AKKSMGWDVLSDSEIPCLHGGSFHRGIHSPRRIDRAGWRRRRPWFSTGRSRRSTGVDSGEKRGQGNIEKGHRSIVRREVAQGIFQVILKIIVRSESRSDGSLAFSERVPCQSHARAEQKSRIVLRERGPSDSRSGQQDSVRTGNVVTGSMKPLVEAIGEFVPQTETQVQIRTQADGVVHIPGSLQ